MAIFYPAVIEKSSDGYSVFFPDLPGCTSGGDTLQQAAWNAEEALQGHLELSTEHGERLPPPSDLDAIAVDPDVVEAARILVRTDLPEHSSVTAQAVRFDEAMMWVELTDGRQLGVPLGWFPRLLRGTPAQRAAYRIGPGDLHWDALDEDISIAGLLAGRGDQTHHRAAAE